MERQMDCPHCGSTHTFFQPETAWERWCADCFEVWDQRTQEEIENE